MTFNKRSVGWGEACCGSQQQVNWVRVVGFMVGRVSGWFFSCYFVQCLLAGSVTGEMNVTYI